MELRTCICNLCDMCVDLSFSSALFLAYCLFLASLHKRLIVIGSVFSF